MAKAKTTRKWIASNYKCVSAGYCELQYLLRYQSVRFYTAGVYGWNFDVYTFGSYAITTGYRATVDHTTTSNYKIIEEYENKARAVVEEGLDSETEAKKINLLLKEFLEKVFNIDFTLYGIGIISRY